MVDGVYLGKHGHRRVRHATCDDSSDADHARARLLSGIVRAFLVTWFQRQLLCRTRLHVRASGRIPVDRSTTESVHASLVTGSRGGATAYYLPLLAAQIAVAFFYFGAFWAKIYNGGIYWALGDNMRIMVGITWNHPYRLHEIPWSIAFLLAHPWVWQSAALVHLVSQFLPMTAAFFIHRPAVRLFEAFVYVAGVFGLYHVMTVWNPQWLWLAAVFVDWEWVISRCRAVSKLLVPGTFAIGTHGGTPRAYDTPPPTPGRVIALGYVLALLGYATWVCGFQVANKHLNYPFSSFDFYSTVYSLPPYSEHKHHTFLVGGIRIRTPACPTPKSEFVCNDGVTEFNRRVPQISTFFEYYRFSTSASIVGALSSIRDYIDTFHPKYVPQDARIELLARLWQYPPYPAPLNPEITFEALRGVRLPDGRILTASGIAVARTGTDQSVVINEMSGFVRPIITVYGYRDAWYSYGRPVKTKLPGKWSSPNTFDADLTSLARPQWVTIGIREEGQNEEFEFYGPIFY